MTEGYDADGWTFLRQPNPTSHNFPSRVTMRQPTLQEIAAAAIRDIDVRNTKRMRRAKRMAPGNDVELKQIQLSMRLYRTVQSAATSEYVTSAQFTLRAKSTTS